VKEERKERREGGEREQERTFNAAEGKQNEQKRV
jgi:hypothetical protein